MMEEYASLSSDLVSALKLKSPPIAICFADLVPDGFGAPASRAPAGCRFWQDATSASFGCCGARAYLSLLADSISLFAFPGANLEAYAERIVALASANATLSKFHQIRRKAIHAGHSPTIRESLQALAAG